MMNTIELMTYLPMQPLAPAQIGTEWRVRLGKLEAELVGVLLAQREHACQSGSHASLCLTQDALAAQLRLPYATPAERQRAVWTLQQTIWRVNPKLAVHDLVIVRLYFLGVARYALFQLQEVWTVS
jgi:hypothetical protein